MTTSVRIATGKGRLEKKWLWPCTCTWVHLLSLCPFFRTEDEKCKIFNAMSREEYLSNFTPLIHRCLLIQWNTYHATGERNSCSCWLIHWCSRSGFLGAIPKSRDRNGHKTMVPKISECNIEFKKKRQARGSSNNWIPLNAPNLCVSHLVVQTFNLVLTISLANWSNHIQGYSEDMSNTKGLLYWSHMLN